MDNLHLDPQKYFKDYLNNKIKEEAGKYFDELVKKTNTNEEENRATYKKLVEEQEKDKANESKLRKFQAFKVISIILIVLCSLITIGGIYVLATSLTFDYIYLLIVIFSILIIVGASCLLGLYLNKKVIHHKHIDNVHNAEIIRLDQEAFNQLNSLLHSFNYYDLHKIIKNTTDLFTLDPILDPKKLQILREHYNFSKEPTNDQSVVGVFSGDVKTNPFIRIKCFSTKLQDKVYTGSITITWTESYTDSEGNSRTRMRSQVLTASVTAPAPSYYNNSYLAYANEAAPDLSFNRYKTGLGVNPSEKEIEKFIKSHGKKIEKLSRKSLKQGGDFQHLANLDFESLFNAVERDHEVQFRLLFTPLAQQNMTKLVTQSPFGDDFKFYKRKKINYIASDHGIKYFDFNANMFKNYRSVDNLKKDFISEIRNLFASIYYELAPLLAIPLYQQTDAGIYDLDKFDKNVSDFEAEAFVNKMNPVLFFPHGANTDQILKVQYNQTVKNTDIYDVTSFAYKAVERVTYISRYGGDGYYHDVPVYWTEYIPLSKTSSVGIRNFNGDKAKFAQLLSDEQFTNKISNASLTNVTNNKKFIGFYFDGCDNYDDDLDNDLSTIIENYIEKL